MKMEGLAEREHAVGLGKQSGQQRGAGPWRAEHEDGPYVHRAYPMGVCGNTKRLALEMRAVKLHGRQAAPATCPTRGLAVVGML